jgi:deoxyribodipyrimidine photolyase-like uncharacterized protein
MNIFVILPDQLFAAKECIDTILLCDRVYIVEDPLYFNSHAHRSKLAMYRGAMRQYYRWLCEINKSDSKITYIEHKKILTFAPSNPNVSFLEYFLPIKCQLNMFRPSSMYMWGNRIYDYRYFGLPIKFHESPAFLLEYRFVKDNYKKGKHLFANFCKTMWEKFSFPNGAGKESVGAATPTFSYIADKEFSMAKSYVKKEFPGAPGKFFRWPINHNEAESLFVNFLKARGQHSFLAPSINCGLLTPGFIVKQIKKNKLRPIIFLRGLIAREYVRMLYLTNDIFIENAKDHHEGLPSGLIEGKTGVIDEAIGKINLLGYCGAKDREKIAAYLVEKKTHPSIIQTYFTNMFIDGAQWAVMGNVDAIAKNADYTQFPKR